MQQAVCVRSKEKEKKKHEIPPNSKKHTTKYIHSSQATATTSRRRAVKHVPFVSPYSHSSSIDPGFVEIGLACIHTYQGMYNILALLLLLRRLCTFWCSILFSGQRSFVVLCCDTRMYLRFRGCPVVLDIELFVSAWYHKARFALLRARRLLLLLLLTAESREHRAAACDVRHNVQTGVKWSRNKITISRQSNTRKFRRTQNSPA